ncbi:A disintegrin and metalloproteinase with thrombospondin motifs family protein [Euroglyphus maynei]|uniref:A disintegrin and metalloproteinase with thrombospondin motifs family protein n=1 Tax=Euroglyphus maynei TaxID=6958 RepID=A0A1Y3B980_EURMA|nr:A disintegrin and metalloproteinase with thrombospondin motifs family protein [Euroglyphus maynei]
MALRGHVCADILVAQQPWPFQSNPPKLQGSLNSNNQNHDDNNYLNAMNALREFGHWIYNHTATEQSDLILILTGDDLCLDHHHPRTTNTSKQYESCSYSSVKGQSVVGGACRHRDHRQHRALNLAIVEDYGLKMDGLHTMAHELGHLLGAVHDGEWPLATIGGPGGANCRDGSPLIMSRDHPNNHQQLQTEWSKCTLEQFQHFFSTPQSICLFNEPTNKQIIS